MEIKIGVRNAPREIVIDVDEDAEAISALLTDALPDGVFKVADAKGRHIIIPARNVAYLDVSTTISGTVGFRS
ncbi:MAG TPA: DUF3107 domain-containing protein [Marmoricola sp.]|nr:DUF3107 domain-containing protein [Marmoricola sp.]HNI70210.1 DUF3107 domain-containing protein [Marmoricola sp.]HNJ78884.1 DUF3107 domain-containing protein [Marmoricola sp.]HNN48388.1 DUF3107 domain-containing protein [Marmoricola sp.]